MNLEHFAAPGARHNHTSNVPSKAGSHRLCMQNGKDRGSGAIVNLCREALPERKLAAQLALVFGHFTLAKVAYSNKDRRQWLVTPFSKSSTGPCCSNRASMLPLPPWQPL